MNCSENMAADEKDRFIQHLVDKVNTYELDKRATELAVEEFQFTFDSLSFTWPLSSAADIQKLIVKSNVLFLTHEMIEHCKVL